MEIILIYGVIAVYAVWVYQNRRQSKAGVITVKNKPFGYILGDYLKSEDTSFHGLDVILPYSMANFYLDSHKDSHTRGPGVLFDPSQKLALEGNFNKYFQLFIPKGSQVLALSILSPDVMQTLMESSERYDVELYDHHLRIISINKVYNGPAEAELMKAAKAVLAEIDHRATSWQTGPEPPPKLKYRKGVTLKLAGRYLRRSRLIAALSVVIVGVLGLGIGLSFYYTLQDPNFSDPYSKGKLAGTLIYGAMGLVAVGTTALMVGPIAWFLSSRYAGDIFPGRPRKVSRLPWDR